MEEVIEVREKLREVLNSAKLLELIPSSLRRQIDLNSNYASEMKRWLFEIYAQADMERETDQLNNKMLRRTNYIRSNLNIEGFGLQDRIASNLYQ